MDDICCRALRRGRYRGRPERYSISSILGSSLMAALAQSFLLVNHIQLLGLRLCGSSAEIVVVVT
jgi:hypothetical protein